MIPLESDLYRYPKEEVGEPTYILGLLPFFEEMEGQLEC